MYLPVRAGTGRYKPVQAGIDRYRPVQMTKRNERVTVSFTDNSSRHQSGCRGVIGHPRI